LNIAYVGVRYAIGCHPNDLWKSYFTSSKYVAEFRLEHGEPDHIEVLETYLTPELALAAEADAIRDFELHKDPQFLNRNLCGQPEWTTELRELVGRKSREAADKKSPKVLLDGQHVSLRQIARDYGIRLSTLKRRFESGLPIEQLILPVGSEGKAYVYNGQLCSSNDLARIAGISPQGMRKRLSRMSFDDAMSIATRH
jgi:hypothetical protein